MSEVSTGGDDLRAEPSSGSLRVLVVEDEPTEYELTQHLLASLRDPPVVCESAQTLETACRRVTEGGVDLVLLDLRLPDAEGLEALVRLRSRAPDLPIIVITGLQDEETPRHAIRQGAQDYLFKGHLTREQLGRAIRYALERARAEASLRRYREHLEDLIAARTAELRAANEKLEQEIALRRSAEADQQRLLAELMEARKLEAVGRLAAGIAHEFNNALTVVLGYADLLLERAKAEDPLRAELQRIRDGAQRAADVTRQLLALGRRQMMQFRSVAVNVFLDGLTAILRPLLGETITLQVRPCEERLAFEVDEEQLKTVFINLASNAREAMQEGGRLTLRAESLVLDRAPPGVEISTGGFVCLTVEDTGPGLDPETMEHLFEPFFSLKKSGHSRGLGLAVAYGIVRQHGGWIAASSQAGSGSVFRVFLPARPWSGEAGESVGEPPSPSSASNGMGELILLVEDEALLREFLTQALIGHGYRVLAAENGGTAKAIFETVRSECCILFSDVVLPDGDGIRLADDLRTLAPDLKVLLSSGYPESDYRGEVMRKKGYGYLGKPYAIRTLLNALRTTLDRTGQGCT